MTDRAPGSSPPAISTGIRSHRLVDFGRDAAIALGIGVFLAILAPLGTDQFGWPGVFAYWIGAVFFGYLVAYGVRLLIDRWRGVWPLWVWIAALAFGIAAPMTAALAGAGAIFGAQIGLPSLAVGFFYVFVVSLGISTFAIFTDRAVRGGTGMADAAAAAAASPSFKARLPARLAGGELYAVEAEDHYLRVHTSRGDDLVLMRFSDALRELEGFDGLQVHRSWWVARAGVQKIQRQDGRIALVLRSGQTVSVSRSNQGAIRRAGWG